MAWWDEENPDPGALGAQWLSQILGDPGSQWAGQLLGGPMTAYGTGLGGQINQAAGGYIGTGGLPTFQGFGSAYQPSSGQAGPGNWFDTFPLGAGTPASGQAGPGTWFDTFPGAAEAAAPTLGGYPGLESLYSTAYTPPQLDLSRGVPTAAGQPAPVNYTQGSGPFAPPAASKLTFPQRAAAAPPQSAAGYGQQSAGQQRAAGYGGQATAGVGGPQARASSTAYPQTQGYTGGTSQAANVPAGGAAGGLAPVAGGGVYGAQKWSSSMGSNAVDIFVPRGTPVQAPVSGTLQQGQNGQLILVGDNGLNFAFRHGQTTAQGRVRQGQQIGVVNDPGMDMLGQAPWGNMPDGYQHLELSVSQGSPSFPGTPGGGGNVDAAQWLESVGYRGNKIGRTPGPTDARGGGMGMSGYGGTSGGGVNPFGGGMFGLGQNPMQMLQGLFGGR